MLSHFQSIGVLLFHRPGPALVPPNANVAVVIRVLWDAPEEINEVGDMIYFETGRSINQSLAQLNEIFRNARRFRWALLTELLNKT